MSRKGLFSAAMFASLLLALLGGCSQLGIDIHDRLSMFATVLNAVDRSAINAQFDQSLTQNLPTMNAAWWNANFPLPPDADHAYGITLLDYVDPTNVVATIRGPPGFNGNTGVPVNAVFVMSRSGADWFIEQLYLNGNTTALIQ